MCKYCNAGREVNWLPLNEVTTAATATTTTVTSAYPGTAGIKKLSTTTTTAALANNDKSKENMSHQQMHLHQIRHQNQSKSDSFPYESKVPYLQTLQQDARMSLPSGYDNVACELEDQPKNQQENSKQLQTQERNQHVLLLPQIIVQKVPDLGNCRRIIHQGDNLESRRGDGNRSVSSGSGHHPLDVTVATSGEGAAASSGPAVQTG